MAHASAFGGEVGEGLGWKEGEEEDEEGEDVGNCHGGVCEVGCGK